MLNEAARGELVALLGPRARFDEPMSRHTSFRIGGPADAFLMPISEAELRAVMQLAAAYSLPLLVIGGGTNLLVRDGGIRGLVVQMGEALGVMRFRRERAIAGAGCPLPRLAREAAKRGLTGLEFTVGIPGTVGGAVVMNAGAAEHEIGELVQRVRVLGMNDGKVSILKQEELAFAYRTSSLRDGRRIVLEVELNLARSERQRIEGQMAELLRSRQRIQPLSLPSAGSVFKNPEGDVAARMIEEAGCKGMQVGEAQVSNLHAGWIVNLGRARAKDVLSLMGEIQRRVRDGFSVELEPEIAIVGEEP